MKKLWLKSKSHHLLYDSRLVNVNAHFNGKYNKSQDPHLHITLLPKLFHDFFILRPNNMQLPHDLCYIIYSEQAHNPPLWVIAEGLFHHALIHLSIISHVNDHKRIPFESMDTVFISAQQERIIFSSQNAHNAPLRWCSMAYKSHGLYRKPTQKHIHKPS